MDFFFAISARTRTFLTVEAGKLDDSVSKLVLSSPGDLTSGSDNVTSARYELPVESLSNFRSGQRQEKNKTFPFSAKRLERFMVV